MHEKKIKMYKYTAAKYLLKDKLTIILLMYELKKIDIRKCALYRMCVTFVLLI